jgi:acyl carrier protein
MNNLKKYQSVFVDIFNVPLEVLNDNFTFANTENWDSITHMGLIADLETVFDVMLDTEEILNFGSYENGKKYCNLKV